MNKLARTLIYAEPVEVNRALEQLTQYADIHFSDEEEIWFEYFGENDSWLSSHLNDHAVFLPKVLELNERNRKVPIEDIVEDIVKFLIRWLALHIINTDKKMAMAVEMMQAGGSKEEAKVRADKKMGGSMRHLIETILDMYNKLSSSAIAMMRERNARLKAETELQEAHNELKVLRGILPICCHCKKIRNNNGDWDQLEAYIDNNSEASFSHSVCPDCMQLHYSRLNEKKL